MMKSGNSKSVNSRLSIGKAKGTACSRAVVVAKSPLLPAGAQNPLPEGTKNVLAFLEAADLQHLSTLMLQNGFDDMESLMELDESLMKEIGISGVDIPKLKDHLEMIGHMISQNTQPANSGCPFASSISQCPTPRSAEMNTAPGHQRSQAMMNIIPLTEPLVALLKESWLQIQMDGCEHLGKLLAEIFFNNNPEIASASGMEWNKVIKAIGLVVDHLDNLDGAEKKLARLGANHARWRTKEQDLQHMKVAFLSAINSFFGDECTADIELAWSHVYDFVAAAMMSGLKQAQSKGLK